jgi:hypothetical protein
MRCRLQRCSIVAIVGCECRCCAVKFLTAGSSDLASRAVFHQGYSSAALLHVVGGCSRTQLICIGVSLCIGSTYELVHIT